MNVWFQWLYGEWCFNVCMVNGVSMVELYGQWCFNGGIVWSMVFQLWSLYGEWCFNGGVCMVNGVSMVESVW